MPADSALAPRTPPIRGDGDALLHHFEACFPQAREVWITVAFVMDAGVDLIRPFLEDQDISTETLLQGSLGMPEPQICLAARSTPVHSPTLRQCPSEDLSMVLSQRPANPGRSLFLSLLFA